MISALYNLSKSTPHFSWREPDDFSLSHILVLFSIPIMIALDKRHALGEVGATGSPIANYLPSVLVLTFIIGIIVSIIVCSVFRYYSSDFFQVSHRVFRQLCICLFCFGIAIIALDFAYYLEGEDAPQSGVAWPAGYWAFPGPEKLSDKELEAFHVRASVVFGYGLLAFLLYCIFSLRQLAIRWRAMLLWYRKIVASGRLRHTWGAVMASLMTIIFVFMSSYIVIFASMWINLPAWLGVKIP